MPFAPWPRNARVRGWLAPLLALGLVAAGCSDDDSDPSSTFEGESGDLVAEIEVTDGPNSVLSAVVAVDTDAPAQISVVAEGDGQTVTVPPTDDFDTRHEIPLVGMRADTSYSVTVTAVDDAGEETTVDEVGYRTGSLPDDFAPLEIESDPDRMADGITFLDLAAWDDQRDGPRGYVVALDAEGEVVWYYENDVPIWDVSPTTRGTLLVDVGEVTIREIDLLGNTLRELGSRVATEYVRQDFLGGSFTTDDTVPIAIDSSHHELDELPNGNLITLSTEVVPLDPAVAGTLCPDNPPPSFVGDVVVELTPDGEVAQEWRLSEAFDVAARPGTDMCVEGLPIAPPNWFYPQASPTRDWSHGNAVVLDEAANTLIVSLRHLDAVVGLRYHADEAGPAGELLWELGPNGTLELTDGDWQYHQHAPEIQDDGHLLIYDNGNLRPGTASAEGDEPDYSRAVEYEVDFDAGTVRQVWEHRTDTADGGPVYASFLGDVDRLENGNVLVTHGGLLDGDGIFSARIVEVVPDDDSGGDIVFDVTVGDGRDAGWSVYRAERVPSPYFAGLVSGRS